MSFRPPALTNLIGALRSRGVFAVAATYFVAAFALVQVVAAVVPALRLPDWANTLAVVGALLGFPIALVIAWLYRWTPAGLERDSSDSQVSRPLVIAAFAAALVVAGGFAAWRITRDIAETDRYRPPIHGAAGSVAVLRCDNQAEPALDYLARGIAEEVASRLARLSALKVVASSRVAEEAMAGAIGLRTFGADSGVEHVLACSLRPSTEGLRISVRLLETKSSVQEWSASYGGSQEELIRTVDGIAIETADRLLERLLGPDRARLARHRTSSAEAFDLFMRAHARWQDWDPAHGAESLELLDRALAIDPGFALAHVEKAAAMETLYQFGAMTRAQFVSRAQQAIDSALATDQELAEAHALKGQLAAQYELDIPAAMRHLELALAREPNSLHVMYFACNSGNAILAPWAIAVCERWRAQRPDDPFAWSNVSGAYKFARDFERAVAEADLGIARYPDYWLLPWIKAHSLLALGRCNEAVAASERALALSGVRSQDVLNFYAASLYCAGQRTAADAVLAEIPTVDPKWAPDPNVYRAIPLAVRGDYDEALRACEIAVDHGFFMGLDCYDSYYFDAVRDSARFKAYERRLQLPPAPPSKRVPRSAWERGKTEG